ncbi:putative monocarboxylate transporter [Schistosoma mansoni]|uniref:putative monocarboxylate transporter n=1 Tax=Schistosoma mansoni TaxID=6183 RepID=UPI0001A61C81|nr:putative monocarboxylate transporter [Schistosoma mansoni]|eukprot:XP_018649290.1 putative monocarboxylate transporter [Schistosoma mansoni]
MLCVHRESSAPTLPIQQFYIGSDDTYGIADAIHNSIIPPVNQTKHISISSNEPVKSISIDYYFLREPAPNGGWGWLVALGSFLCIFAVDGVCFTFGLHINEMIHEGQFRINPSDPNESQRKPSLALLSLPGALLCGMYFLFGPFTSALVNRFGYRIVASVGAVITSLCFLISALFIYDLVTFIVVFGIIGGIGCSLVYLPAITVIGHWFEEHRALIVGIVMCGGCLGAGLMAIITPYLAVHFSWRGSLILISGLFSQTLVGIALFRPVSVHERIRAVRLLKQMAKKQIKQKKYKLNCLLFSHKPKHHPTRKTAIQRGSIMARIIEEKSRQRTTSTGSLDGMVITRENELVALSSDAYEVVKAAAVIYSANTNNTVLMNTKQKEQIGIQNKCEENPLSSSFESTSYEQLKPSNSMNAKSNSLRYSLDNNRKNLQTLTEGFPMSSFNQTTEKFQTNSQPPCIAVLPPPVQFSRAAVRRIARAILRKLHGQSRLPFSPSITSISTGSRQVIPSSFRFSGDNRIDSCANFSTPYTNSSRNVLYDRVNQVYRYDLCHGSVATNIWRQKRSLFASSLYSELAPNIRDSVASTALVRHLSTAVSRPISAQESHIRLKLPTPDSPSGLTSLISLDSYTGHIISRELNSLLLDQSTKLAILNDIRRELSRPKYRPDFFYSGNKRKLPLYHVPEYTTCKQLSCDANYTLKELTIQSHNPIVNQCPNLFEGIIPVENIILTRNKSLISDNQKSDIIIQSLKQNKSISNLQKFITSPRTSELFSYLADMLDNQILKSFTFIILSIACFVNMLGLYIEKGLNTNRKFLCRFPLMVDPMLLNNVALIVCGLSVISFPLAIHGILLTKNSDQFSSQRLLQAWSLKFRRHLLYLGSIVYGLTNTISISLRSVILVELFGLRRLTNAFGYLLIFQGLGVICGPPLFGLFSDQACRGCLDNPPFCESIPIQFTSTGHKECTMRLILSFYICAGLLLLSSILFMPLRWLAQHDPYRNAHMLQSSIIISGNTPQLDEDISFSHGLGQSEVYDPQETQTTHVLYDENETSMKTQ